MKFSENWLRQHVPTTATRDELAATLTAIGLEVEEVTPLGEALDGVVVARIVSAEKHPEADRLQVCQIDAGNGAMLQNYGVSMAGALFASLPTLLVYVLLGKYFVGGLMAGSVKS